MPQRLSCQPPANESLRAAAAAVENAIVVTSERDVESVVELCATSRTIGLDTEFVRERTFYPQPGLIQISDGQRVWLLDAVALPRAPALGRLLAARATSKVLHSVGEDLEILQLVGERWPRPLFDTQIAAALLGMPLQSRYEHLVHAAFGIELGGGKARNDWRARPLPPALLRYAAEDVIWLPRLKERLEKLLERAGRLAWHREDCQRIVERASAGDAAPALSHVRGAGRLDTPDLAHLDALARWRETMARQQDLPRRFVIGDEVLINLAQAAGSGRLRSALGKLPAGQRKRFGPALEKTLAAAPPDNYQRPRWLDALGPQQREQLREAQKIVRAVAGELEIDPAIIASKRELTRLIRGEHPDWLDGWRGELLAGRLDIVSVINPTP